MAPEIVSSISIPPDRRPGDPLRFSEGARVEVCRGPAASVVSVSRIENGRWEAATIIGLDYSQGNWCPGFCAAYLARLDDVGEDDVDRVVVRDDDERCIRSIFGAGKNVLVDGLQGRKDLNGKTAVVIKFKPAIGRYRIKFDGSGEIVAVRSANLTEADQLLFADPPPPAENSTTAATMKKAKRGDVVEFKGLTGAVHLNGSRGTLTKYLKKEKRWAVDCYAGVVTAKRENLVLVTGKRPVIPDHPSIHQALDDSGVVSHILSFFDWRGILKLRVNRKWREAARLTDVPESESDDGWGTPELHVKNRAVAEALGWIAEALPRIPVIGILNNLRKSETFGVADGQDPPTAPPTIPTDIPTVIPTPARSFPDPPVDISTIAKFRRLKKLEISIVDLNGKYPFLFDFPELKSLTLADNGKLVWDLELLKGLPKLEKLRILRGSYLTGTLKKIRVARATLVDLCLSLCGNVSGDLMDLADFPRLEEVRLIDCNKITGNIGEIKEGDFVSIKTLDLPDSIKGGGDLPSIAETPEIMHAWSILKRRNPELFRSRRMGLSLDSSERYENGEHHSRGMPCNAEFVEAGPRLGWRWTNCVRGGSCEPNWLDPEPKPSDERYGEYKQKMREIENDAEFYKGYTSPPSREQHRRMVEETPLPESISRYQNGTEAERMQIMWEEMGMGDTPMPRMTFGSRQF